MTRQPPLRPALSALVLTLMASAGGCSVDGEEERRAGTRPTGISAPTDPGPPSADGGAQRQEPDASAASPGASGGSSGASLHPPEAGVTERPAGATSPGGRTAVLAYATNRPGAAGIVVHDGTERRVASAPGTYFGPRWSPDGSRLAYASEREGNVDVYLAAADGSGERRLTVDPTEDFAPTWSPDGTQVAYVSRRVGSADSYGSSPATAAGSDRSPAVVETTTLRRGVRTGSFSPSPGPTATAGEGERRLTTDPGEDLLPTWSPDGSRPAWVSRRGGNTDLWVVGSSSESPRRLTNDPAEDEAVWAPDGARLAFVSDRDGNREIYILDGAAQVRLTSSPGGDFAPAWRP